MPIKPENKDRYPDNWKEISEDIRFNRAKNKCEVCGVPNYAVGYRDKNSDFVPIGGNIYADLAGQGISYPSLDPLTYKEAREIAEAETTRCVFGRKYIVIVLTVAHLDHIPENCDYSNLMAMCQRCHNNYDKTHRKGTIRSSRMKGQLYLNL